MAVRPIFLPRAGNGSLVEQVDIQIQWFGGFAVSQKQKNIRELHYQASLIGIEPILEISTKSLNEVGRRLSAFNLKIDVGGELKTLESVYQSAKVFSDSGQHIELMDMGPFDAKKEVRRLGRGDIIAFEFMGEKFPTEPKNAFYDWLYIRAIAPHEEWIRSNLDYAAYSDIEFTPGRSINCQGRAVAEFHALSMRGHTAKVVENFDTFRKMLLFSQREGGEI